MDRLEEIFERYKDEIRIESLDILDPFEMELVVPSAMLDEYMEFTENRGIIGFWKDMDLQNKLLEIKDLKIRYVYDCFGGGSSFKYPLSSIHTYHLSSLKLVLDNLTDVEASFVQASSISEDEKMILYKAA